MRAYEHWRGNTHLTVADVIYGLVEQGKLASVALTTVIPWPPRRPWPGAARSTDWGFSSPSDASACSALRS